MTWGDQGQGRKRKKAFYRKCAAGGKQGRWGHKLEAGERGFLVLCNDNEAKAVAEAYDLLGHYADILYGPGKSKRESAMEQDFNQTNDSMNELGNDSSNCACANEVLKESIEESNKIKQEIYDNTYASSNATPRDGMIDIKHEVNDSSYERQQNISIKTESDNSLKNAPSNSKIASPGNSVNSSHPGHNSNPSSDEDNDDDDVEKAFKREVQSLKKTPKEKARFQNSHTRARNCLFFKSTVEEPVDVSLAAMLNIAETRIKKCRFAVRFLPVAGSCRAANEPLKDLARQLLPRLLGPRPDAPSALASPKSYTVVYKARSYSGGELEKHMIVRDIQGIVRELLPDLCFSWNDFEAAVLVEVVGPVACLVVAPHYAQLRRYNVHELAIHGLKGNIPLKMDGEPGKEKDMDKETSDQTCDLTTESTSQQTVKNECKNTESESSLKSISDSQKDSNQLSSQVKSEPETTEPSPNT